MNLRASFRSSCPAPWFEGTPLDHERWRDGCFARYMEDLMSKSKKKPAGTRAEAIRPTAYMLASQLEKANADLGLILSSIDGAVHPRLLIMAIESVHARTELIARDLRWGLNPTPSPRVSIVNATAVTAAIAGAPEAKD